MGPFQPPRADWPRDSEPHSPGSRETALRLAALDAMRRAAAEHDCRAVRAHQPRVLRVFVNGFEVATHEINGAATRVTQTVSGPEPVWLSEVYSEQDVCMASLDILPIQDAPAEQRVTVELGDERRIEIALSFRRQSPALHLPTLHLVYDDAAYSALPLGVTRAAGEAAGSEAGRVETARLRPDLPAPHPLQPDRRDADCFDAGVSGRALRSDDGSWRASSVWTLRRPPRHAWAATAAVLACVLFFTPGTFASAAERIWRGIAALAGGEPGSGRRRYREAERCVSGTFRCPRHRSRRGRPRRQRPPR